MSVTAFMATGEGYRAVRRAIVDPGSVTPRRRSQAHGGLESVIDWQTRAVLATLGRHRAAAIPTVAHDREDQSGAAGST